MDWSAILQENPKKWHLFAITRLPVDNIFEGFPLDEMRKVAAAYGNDCVPRRLGMVSAAYVRRHKKGSVLPTRDLIQEAVQALPHQ